MITQPVRLQRLHYLVRRQHLRINKVVQTHRLEEFLVLRQQVLVVIYPRQRLLCAQLISHQARRHVLRLVRCNSYKQVATVHAYILQVTDGCRTPHFRQQVIVRVQVTQTVLTLVHQTDFHVLAREKLRQMRAYFSGTCNNNSHIPSLSKRSMWYNSFVLPCSTN